MNGAYAIALDDISKRFGRTDALAGATLRARPGTVHALLGENGAGKTTLMRIAYGMLRPDAGTIAIGGRPVAPRSPSDAIAHGIGMVHQHFMNVPAMSVAENVALGRRGAYHAGRAAATVRDVAARVGLPLDPDARVADLGVGAQQRLEIVKALARDARILILDEPTAVLAPQEADELLRWLRAFADAGHTVILITHKLREALAIADDLTVLRMGRTVLAARRDAVAAESLARAMLGGDVPLPARAIAVTPGAPAIVAEGLDVRDDDDVRRIVDADLVVRRGEILGVAAVEGAGQRMLLRALAGRASRVSGRLDLPPLVGFVPEDRQRDALVPEFTITENVALANAAAHRGIMRWSAWRERARTIIDELDVRAPGSETTAGALSGGNQQKLVLGRELRAAPTALIAENPTRGLDLRATAAVHERLRAARDAGMAIVVYSSDLDEVLALATRVVVVHAGRVREVPLDRGQVGRAMLGVT